MPPIDGATRPASAAAAPDSCSSATSPAVALDSSRANSAPASSSSATPDLTFAAAASSGRSHSIGKHGSSYHGQTNRVLAAAPLLHVEFPFARRIVCEHCPTQSGKALQEYESFRRLVGHQRRTHPQCRIVLSCRGCADDFTLVGQARAHQLLCAPFLLSRRLPVADAAVASSPAADVSPPAADVSPSAAAAADVSPLAAAEVSSHAAADVFPHAAVAVLPPPIDPLLHVEFPFARRIVCEHCPTQSGRTPRGYESFRRLVGHQRRTHPQCRIVLSCRGCAGDFTLVGQARAHQLLCTPFLLSGCLPVATDVSPPAAAAADVSPLAAADVSLHATADVCPPAAADVFSLAATDVLPPAVTLLHVEFPFARRIMCDQCPPQPGGALQGFRSFRKFVAHRHSLHPSCKIVFSCRGCAGHFSLVELARTHQLSCAQFLSLSAVVDSRLVVAVSPPTIADSAPRVADSPLAAANSALRVASSPLAVGSSLADVSGTSTPAMPILLPQPPSFLTSSTPSPLSVLSPPPPNKMPSLSSLVSPPPPPTQGSCDVPSSPGQPALPRASSASSSRLSGPPMGLTPAVSAIDGDWKVIGPRRRPRTPLASPGPGSASASPKPRPVPAQRVAPSPWRASVPPPKPAAPPSRHAVHLPSQVSVPAPVAHPGRPGSSPPVANPSSGPESSAPPRRRRRRDRLPPFPAGFFAQLSSSAPFLPRPCSSGHCCLDLLSKILSLLTSCPCWHSCRASGHVSQRSF